MSTRLLARLTAATSTTSSRDAANARLIDATSVGSPFTR